MCAKQVNDDHKKEVQTTGHSWDGIEELDNPMPRWWVWVFYICIIWGVGYTIVYPSWPLINGAVPGLAGWSSRGAVVNEISAHEEANAAIKSKLVETELTEIKNDPELLDFAQKSGAAVFRTNCMQCHGAGAAGVQGLGYPNLLDDDWLWGGDIESIYTTVAHGIRNTTDPDARYAEMPKFGADGILEPEQITNVVEYVRQISGQEHDAAKAEEGATVFADNCMACHGETGEGSTDGGAPRLNDAIWLYGGSREAITHSVTYARFGVMPNWNQRLSEDQIRSVALFVHGLGGGQ